METIVNRLKKYLDYVGVSVSVAEKKINISNGSLSKPFNANTTIKTDALEKFLKVYNDINPEWLIYGKHPMLTKEISGKGEVIGMFVDLDFNLEPSDDGTKNKNTTSIPIDKGREEELLSAIKDKKIIIAYQAKEIVSLQNQLAQDKSTTVLEPEKVREMA